MTRLFLEGYAMQILHTMLRVVDLEKSIKFYTEVLEMKELRRTDYPNGKFTLAFVGYGNEEEHTVIELTHNWETKSYDLGNAYGHIAIRVEDIFKVCDKVKALGYTVSREPGPMKFGGTRNIAFIVDPDSYKIELIEGHI